MRLGNVRPRMVIHLTPFDRSLSTVLIFRIYKKVCRRMSAKYIDGAPHSVTFSKADL